MAIILGCTFGYKIAGKVDISWLSGLVLMGLAFSKII
jgi:hypothetical protein